MNAEGSEKTTPSFATDLTGAPRVGSDEFFYDIFGINIKGLKSIWTLLKRPAEYFDAARLPDWGGEHWPSIRLWLGLMGILIGLQFIWASESSEMTAMFQTLAILPGDTFNSSAGPNDPQLDLSILDRQALGKQGFKRWIFIYPFFFIAAMCVLAFIFRVWKPAASFVIRLRFIFGIIVPGSVLGLFMTLLMVNTSGELYRNISFAMFPLMYIIYAVTTYRGPLHAHETGERVGLSLIIPLLILIFLVVAQTISMVIAVVPIWVEVSETLRPQRDAIDAAKAALESTA